MGRCQIIYFYIFSNSAYSIYNKMGFDKLI
jgi:hypothetical protein